MALNPELTKRVRQVLAHLDHIEEKKMFRGIAFMVNGKMCVTVGDNHIMCRIDPSIHEEVILHNGVSTVRMKGRDYIGWIPRRRISRAGQKTVDVLGEACTGV